jgi:hypothetical protein
VALQIRFDPNKVKYEPNPQIKKIIKTKIIILVYEKKRRNNKCRTCAASRRYHPPLRYVYFLANMGDNEFLSFISGKIEWESSPNILITRNPNWSQRSGTGTYCVKGWY